MSSSRPPARPTSATEVLEKFLKDLDEGRKLSPEALLAQHPEFGEDLASLLSLMSGIDRLAKSDSREGTPEFEPGTQGIVIDDWEVIRPLGVGGTGVVFEAKHPSYPDKLALKLLPHSSTLQKERLQREVELMGGLQHAHIPRLIMSGDLCGIPYLALELIDGSTLTEIIRERRVEQCGGSSQVEDANSSVTNMRQCLELLADIASALATCHTHNILHRDVKPSNIILSEDDRAFLTDFGFGVSESRSPSKELTRTGFVVGTRGYISPEVGSGGIASAASDVYSFGITALELLTLSGPSALVAALPWETRERRPTPQRMNRLLPRSVSVALQKAVASDPAQRPSAPELEKILRRGVERVGTPRYPWFAITVVTACFALVATGILLVAFTGWPDSPNTAKSYLPPAESQIQQDVPLSSSVPGFSSLDEHAKEGDQRLQYALIALSSDNAELNEIQVGDQFRVGLKTNGVVRLDNKWKQTVPFSCNFSIAQTGSGIEFDRQPQVHLSYNLNSTPALRNGELSGESLLGPFQLIADLTLAVIPAGTASYQEVDIPVALNARAVQSGVVHLAVQLAEDALQTNLLCHTNRELYETEFTVRPLTLKILPKSGGD